jgi:choline dehydrogenase
MTTYDYVIVGAGSAGCVVANRLSADGSRVLLLEAGGSDRRLTVRAPLTFSGQFQKSTDWNYLSESEPALHGRRLQMPRGKVLGGTSSMNAMIYFRGDASDFDGWEADYGAAGWSYRDVLPYFKRSEHNRDFSGEYHGTNGELYVSHRHRWRSSHYETFIESAQSAGIRPNDDFNAERADGVGLLQATIKDGRRWNSADAFLRPAMKRENLDVVTKAHVHRIELTGNRATGVRYAKGSKLHTVRAEREVILCAGAYGSPQLLMLSGIGPADHLHDVGIPVAVNSPHVGQHLHEHPMVFMNWHATGCTTVDDAGPRDLAQWALNRSGKFSTNLVEAAVHWISDASLVAPDFQIIFVPGFFWDGGHRKTGLAGISTLVSYLAPESRGHVQLQSADPTVQPRIFSNILGQTSEVDALVRAIELIRDIASRPPMKHILTEEVQPSAAVGSPTALANWLRSIAEHTYHPTCTCRMGPPDAAVVDPELRVYGVEGLRVADASVMPRITSGNTHAPAVMIGERCADFVLGRKPLAAAPARAVAAAP